eukprot:4144703-Amphidinium_carterae.1
MSVSKDVASSDMGTYTLGTFYVVAVASRQYLAVSSADVGAEACCHYLFQCTLVVEAVRKLIRRQGWLAPSETISGPGRWLLWSFFLFLTSSCMIFGKSSWLEV